MKLRCKYTYQRRYGAPLHIWECIGAAGALHLHITESRDDQKTEPYGGLEVHYRKPPSYREHDAPDHDECNFLKAPCWTDGSSLAVEAYLPYFKGTATDHDYIFDKLHYAYSQQFLTTEDD